jgi:hypothetical protein
MDIGTPNYMIAHGVVTVLKRNNTTVVMVNFLFFSKW